MNSTSAHIQTLKSSYEGHIQALKSSYEGSRVLLLLSIIVGTACWLIYNTNRYKKQTKRANGKTRAVKSIDIKPVADSFDWKTHPPVKSYPFKNAEYRLNMGLKSLDPQDYLLIEPVYADRLTIKNQIITNSHPDYPPDKDLHSSTVLFRPEATEAVKEYYEFVVNYMSTKYPKYFIRDGDMVLNTIIGKKVPARTDSKTDPKKYLEFLCSLIEEDFIILQKDPSRQSEKDGDEYIFKAGIFAFAAGFDPRDRFDTPLSFIHHPIPGYEAKLKKIMNNFFEKMSPSSFVTRSNYSVQTHGKFYVDDANKGHNLPEDYVQTALDYDKLDFENEVHYRSERQVLTKLPKTGAMVFTIRTYLYPMHQIKNEPKEVRERFIGAINGFGDEIAEYKRSKEWGPPVIRYLREDD